MSTSTSGHEAVFGYTSSASASASASASNASGSMSPVENRNCFCGNVIRDGEGIYCSAGCARSDAFSTLCNKPNPPSLASSIALGSSSLNTTYDASASTDNDWDSESHYGHMCRADLRREERKEERRRRRAEGSGSTSSRSTIVSTSSSGNRVPDLVGGHAQGYGHSRNSSVASSRTSSTYSSGGLSRNPSAASSMSRRGYGVNVDTAIMEDDDEAEWLASDPMDGYSGLPHPYAISMPPEIRMPIPTIRGLPQSTTSGVPQVQGKRRPSHSHSNSRSQKKKLEPFGMGQDMRDVLEEIIQMEKEFIIDGSSDEASIQSSQADTNAVFTAVFDRPPRTPSPGLVDQKRISLAPNAPARGHRKSMSMAPLSPRPPIIGQAIDQRPPPFVYGHSASLSESHTALYLATASPETESRKSASPPRMKARNSMTFTPEAAGPIISTWGISPQITPSRRRPGPSPSAHHPTMSGWKFPNYASGAGGNSNMATPTKLTVDTQNYLGAQNLRTPTSNRQRPPSNTRQQLLWPPTSSFNSTNLAPSHFPSSPVPVNAPPQSRIEGNNLIPSPTVNMNLGEGRMQRQRHRGRERQVSPPNSGMRLGVLLGSGVGEEGGINMEMEIDQGEEMSLDNHTFGMGRQVYLSPEISGALGPRFD